MANSSTSNQRTHRRRVMAAAAAILVVIASAGIAMRTEHPSRVASTSTPTTQASTTTEQYGSIVREHSAAIQAWINGEESCDHVECSLPQYVHERYVELQTLLYNFKLALARKPSPPDEIATLVDRTTAQVDDAKNSVDLLVKCGVTTDPSRIPPCDDEESGAAAAYKRLPPVFAAWSPYT